MCRPRYIQDQANPFDNQAEEYDAWFDTTRGQAIFNSELECLRPFVSDVCNPWLEIGVGTGRFAAALGVKYGIDPSQPMLDIAARRGIETKSGIGEELPYQDRSFGGVLIMLTLCFVDNPVLVLREAARVLREDGRLIIGTIPAESPWGKVYTGKGKAGHPIYSKARFLKVDETISLVNSAGFEKRGVHSTLVAGPDSEIDEPLIWPGFIPLAGFVAMGFSLKDPAGRRLMENVPYYTANP